MKNSLLSHHEVESLRSQVRQLRESVLELETRLAEFEDNAPDEDPWGIWPYCYVVGGWNFGRHQFHSFHKKLGKWSLTRRNRRYQLQNDSPLGEMRLV